MRSTTEHTEVSSMLLTGDEDYGQDIVRGVELPAPLPPLSPNHSAHSHFMTKSPASSASGQTALTTRTVAIIKTHALQHRFDIEKRIQEASFEIVKERQMEFDTETDPDTLWELFGEDTDALAEGPVWVYVLERRRAVEVWNTLMGHPDVEVARVEAPNSLRSLYGISGTQNGLMGSADNEIAEIQIASLFASSPPFPTTDLPIEELTERLRLEGHDGEYYDEGYAASNATNTSAHNAPSSSRSGGRASSAGPRSSTGKPLFRARPLPATLDKPDIVPRTTRAAALRAGLQVDATPTLPRAPPSKERLEQTFANVPGHKRKSIIAVASTAAPTIAPRMTKAASLRVNGGHVAGPSASFAPPKAPMLRKRSTTDPAANVEGDEEMTKHGPRKTFEGVPGHKRRESIAVASVKAPTVAPRLNKSAALRQAKEQAPPTSFMFRTSSTPKTPLSRAASQDNLSPSPKPAPVPRPASQASTRLSTVPTTKPTPARSSSVAGVRAPPSSFNGSRVPASGKETPKPTRPGHVRSQTTAANGHVFNGNDDDDDHELDGPTPEPGMQPRSSSTIPPRSSSTVPPASGTSRAKPRPSSIAAPPTIAPRTNRSAALRAAKQEAEQAAAAAAAAKLAAKKPAVKKVPPSSFKAIPV
ncbi:hypothetical protein CVT24_001368 [Panaeolus cyanescens]|uniref:Nucleoside diphosphate kinase n=1 Tax=Panaeolus cyanescens TaxID=181874 RepID=A0A409VTK3_9AGAR|nr:hypothetical protein CVT24_001368 [Panaeolus cyanescens]